MRNITKLQRELMCALCRLTQDGTAPVCNLSRVAESCNIDARSAYLRAGVLERRRIIITTRMGRARPMQIRFVGGRCADCGDFGV